MPATFWYIYTDIEPPEAVQKTMKERRPDDNREERAPLTNRVYIADRIQPRQQTTIFVYERGQTRTLPRVQYNIDYRWLGAYDKWTVAQIREWSQLATTIVSDALGERPTRKQMEQKSCQTAIYQHKFIFDRIIPVAYAYPWSIAGPDIARWIQSVKELDLEEPF